MSLTLTKLHFSLNTNCKGKLKTELLNLVTCKKCLKRNRHFEQEIDNKLLKLCDSKDCNKVVELTPMPEFLRKIGTQVQCCPPCQKKNTKRFEKKLKAKKAWWNGEISDKQYKSTVKGLVRL